MSCTTLGENVSIQPTLQQLSIRGAQDKITNDDVPAFSYWVGYMYEYVLSRPQFVHTDFYPITSQTDNSEYFTTSGACQQWSFEVGVGPDFITKMDLVMQVKGATSKTVANVSAKLKPNAQANELGGKCTNALCATRTAVWADGKAVEAEFKVPNYNGAALKNVGAGTANYPLYSYFGVRDGISVDKKAQLDPTSLDLSPRADAPFISGSSSFVRLVEDFSNSCWTTATLTNGNSSTFETIYSLWNHMYDTLFIPEHRRSTELSGRTSNGFGQPSVLSEFLMHNQYFVTPMRFFFHDRRHYLPAISCYLQKLYININMRNKTELIKLNTEAIESFRDLSFTSKSEPHIKGYQVWTNANRLDSSTAVTTTSPYDASTGTYGQLLMMDPNGIPLKSASGLTDSAGTSIDTAIKTWTDSDIKGFVRDTTGAIPQLGTTPSDGYHLTKAHFEPNIADILAHNDLLKLNGKPKLQVRHIILPQVTRKSWGSASYSYLIQPMGAQKMSLNSESTSNKEIKFDMTDMHNMVSEMFFVFCRNDNMQNGEYYNFMGYENSNVDLNFYTNDGDVANAVGYKGTGELGAATILANSTDSLLSSTESNVNATRPINIALTPAYDGYGVNNDDGYKSLYINIGRGGQWEPTQPPVYYNCYIPSLYYSTIPKEIITCIPFYMANNKQHQHLWHEPDGHGKVTKFLPRCINMSRLSYANICFTLSAAYTAQQQATLYCFYRSYNHLFARSGLLSKSWGSQAPLKPSDFSVSH